MKRRMLTLLVAYFPGNLLALFTFDVHHRETTRNIIIAMGHGIWDVTFSVATGYCGSFKAPTFSKE